MRYLPSLRAALVAALAVLCLLLVAAWSLVYFGAKSSRLQPIAGIGGPFSLVDHRGKPVTEADYLGKPTLVFFGFTHCPDVCPTTLFELTTRFNDMGREADRLNTLFVTVDPERDTPQQLADYLSSFDPRITGLSGSRDKVEAAMKAYRIYARKVPLDGDDYTMDHTATIFMMNSKGQFVSHMNYQEDEAVARVKLKRLLDSE
jgi:protein SCO1/2